jgi:hypothetical protein
MLKLADEHYCRPLEHEKRGWCPHAAYLEDGRVISAQTSHVNFVVRAFYCLVLYFLLQLPEEYGMRVDLNAFFSAFSMWDENHQRVRVQPWHAAPGYRYVNDDTAMDTSTDGSNSADLEEQEALDDDRFVDQEDIRVPMREQWNRYYYHVASHTPYCVCKSTPDVELHDETEDVNGVESTDSEAEIESMLAGKDKGKQCDTGRGLLLSGPGGRPGGNCPTLVMSASYLFKLTINLQMCRLPE